MPAAPPRPAPDEAWRPSVSVLAFSLVSLLQPRCVSSAAR